MFLYLLLRVTSRTNCMIMKRTLIISTAIFTLIHKISGIPSPNIEPQLREYNIVEFEKDTRVCRIDIEYPWQANQLPGSSNFPTFVSRSKYWVDKSLLAERIMDAPDKVILITAPRKWGKTMNLDMLRCIFEDTSIGVSLEKESDRQLFNEKDFSRQFFIEQVVLYDGSRMGTLMDKPLISTKPDFMSKYFQKYPVIDLDFKEFDLTNWRARFTDIISWVYEKHMYLFTHFQSVAVNEDEALGVRKLAEDNMYKFLNFMNTKCDDDGLSLLQGSIVWLCHKLYTVYGKKCFVLIDEFDALQNNVIFHNAGAYEAGTEAIDFMRSFISLTLKSPNNSYIDKAVLTGIVRSAKATLLSGLNNILEYSDVNLANMRQYTPFYGFTPREVETMIRLEKPESFQQYFDTATSYYDGYGSLCLWNGSTFNPWDVMRYIEEFIAESYWDQTGSIDIVKKLLKYNFFEEMLYQTLDPNVGYNITASCLKKVDSSILAEIHRLLANAENAVWYENNMKEEKKSIEDAIASFMCQAGYFTIPSNLNIDLLQKINAGSNVSLIVPNFELKKVLQKTRIQSLLSRHSWVYQSAVDATVNAFTTWFNLDVDEPEKTIRDGFEDFESAMNNLFKTCETFADSTSPKFSKKTSEEFSSYRILNEAAVRRTIAPVWETFRDRTKSTFLEEYQIRNRGRLDTQVLLHDKLLIIEYKSDFYCPLEKVLEQTVNYSSLVRAQFPTQKYQWVKFLAINVYLLNNSNVTKVDMNYTVMNWNQFIEYAENWNRENLKITKENCVICDRMIAVGKHYGVEKICIACSEFCRRKFLSGTENNEKCVSGNQNCSLKYSFSKRTCSVCKFEKCKLVGYTIESFSSTTSVTPTEQTNAQPVTAE
ncbi:uncharacterized protein LOC135836622 [Planococcus citri]|uniref:uncharacterized protein LOC135836622 n=1 Tax=Planococcus citri TaxID=170843 RepID=UPI0031F98BAB